MQVNTDEAVRFLNLLDPDADTFCFQHIHDRDDIAAPPQHLPTRHIKQLSRKAGRGFGTFIAVNEVAGARRTAENVTRARAVIADDDVPRETPRTDWPLAPSIVVESSPRKYHYYWLLSHPIDPRVAEGIKLSIAEHYGTDWAGVAGPNRILRLPGFPHQKRTPYLSRIVHAPGHRYTEHALIEALGFSDFDRVFGKSKYTGDDPLGAALLHQVANNDDLIRQVRQGEYHVVCPWHQEHTNPNDRRSNLLFAGTGGYGHTTWHCHHSHTHTIQDYCAHYRVDPIAEVVNYAATLLKDVPPASIPEVFVKKSDEPGRTRDQPKSSALFKSFSELTAALAPPDWLIKGIIETKTINMVFGDFASFKSFVVLDICLHVASRNVDRCWRGQRTAHGPVFYLAGEGHGGIARRVQAWEQHYKDTEVDFFASVMPANLSDPAQMTVLRGAMADIAERNPALIAIDTLAASSGGKDENSATDMALLLQEITRLINTLDCTVILVHHTGQKEKNRPRGSYALGAGIDAAYRVEKSGAERDQITMTCIKMKDGREPDPMQFQAIEKDIGVDEDGDPVTSMVMAHDHLTPAAAYVAGKGLNGATAIAAEVLFNAGGEMQLKEWSKQTQDRLDNASSKRTFYKAKTRLMDWKLVEIEGRKGAEKAQLLGIFQGRPGVDAVPCVSPPIMEGDS